MKMPEGQLLDEDLTHRSPGSQPSGPDSGARNHHCPMSRTAAMATHRKFRQCGQIQNGY
jgi:hypothetical protein